MFYIIYDKKSGQIEKTIDMPEFLRNLISCDDGQDVIESDETINPALFEIRHGKLVLKPTP